MLKDTDFLNIVDNHDNLLIGLNTSAEDSLGEIKFIDIVPNGTGLKKGDMFASIEAKKAVIELESPIDGAIIDINSKLEDNPELLYKNNDNWIIKLNK